MDAPMAGVDASRDDATEVGSRLPSLLVTLSGFKPGYGDSDARGAVAALFTDLGISDTAAKSGQFYVKVSHV